jgi:hypothetical protein
MEARESALFGCHQRVINPNGPYLYGNGSTYFEPQV